MKKLTNVDMAKYTSFKTGGTVNTLLIVDTEEELISAVKENPQKGFLLLGNGSNTLFATDNYDVPVIKLGEGFDYVGVDCAKVDCVEVGRVEEKEASSTVRVGAATLLSKLARTAGSHGLTGLEFAAGIPGSVGGAVFMNAGAYDGEIKDVLTRVKVLSKSYDESEAEQGEKTPKYTIKNLTVDELDLSYRHSILMETGDIVLEAEFELKCGDVEEINAKMKDLAERRTSKQPLEYPSAGSFFKRPPGNFAGKLIEDSGLKGFTVGGAQVSEKHAGFVINRGGATPKDILDLMEHVQKKVKEDSDVQLEPEIRIIR